MVSKADATQLTSSVVQRGQAIYMERLKHIVEPEHLGKYIVIDVESGEFEIDANHLAASDRAAAKRPGALLYATRVGSQTIGRIGYMVMGN